MNATDIAIIRRYHGKNYPQTRISYVTGSPFAEYIGVAARGASAADAAWLIEKLTYDSDNNVTQSQTSEEFQIWNNRATLTYA